MKDMDSGSPRARTGNNSNGAKPPSNSKPCQPIDGSNAAASQPPMARPRVKPELLSMTNSVRRRAGEYSEHNVMLFGRTPPMPMPVRKRNIASQVGEPAKAQARVSMAMIVRLSSNTLLRPWRSASGPRARLPSNMPNRPAANTGTSWPRSIFQSRSSSGAT